MAFAVSDPGVGWGVKPAGRNVSTAGTRLRASDEGAAFGGMVVLGCLGATVTGLAACVSGVGLTGVSLTPVSVAGVAALAG